MSRIRILVRGGIIGCAIKHKTYHGYVLRLSGFRGYIKPNPVSQDIKLEAQEEYLFKVTKFSKSMKGRVFPFFHAIPFKKLEKDPKRKFRLVPKEVFLGVEGLAAFLSGFGLDIYSGKYEELRDYEKGHFPVYLDFLANLYSGDVDPKVINVLEKCVENFGYKDRDISKIPGLTGDIFESLFSPPRAA